jgi:hypothetical protein
LFPSLALDRWYTFKKEESWAPVVHACNTSHAGDRDQEDGLLKPTQTNSSGDPISKGFNTKQNW